MPTFAWVILSTLVGSVLSAAAAGTYLLLPDRIRDRGVTYLISFAIGMLLGAGFLHLLPEAIEQRGDDIRGLMGTVLLAIMVFFLLEKGLIWRHHHHHGHSDAEACHDASPAGALIMVGDSFHNFLDGVLIAAAYHADFHLGVMTSLAIVAHEIPQELGDFAILLHSGFSRGRAFAFNLMTSLTMIVGATVAWFSLDALTGLVPYLIAFTAASFVYIAVSDLMPVLNRQVRLVDTLVQVTLICAGLGLNALVHD